MSKRIIALTAAAATTLALSACSSPSPSASSSDSSTTLTVMASFYPLKYLTEKVGGEHVTVTSLTPDGAEPHDLELSPRMVDSLASADAVVYLRGFQSAVDDAIDQQAPRTVIDVTPAAHLVEAGQDANHPAEEEGTDATEGAQSDHDDHDHDHDGHDHESHDHEGHHHDLSSDPHFWLDPSRMAEAATLVGQQLAAADPAHASDYQTNAQNLADELNQLSSTLVTRTTTCDVRTFVTAHTAFGYLADRANLTQVGISGLDPDSSPSPARLAEISQIAREQNVTTIFTEALIDPKVAQTLANDLGITTAVLDPIESQTDAANDYAAVMNMNIDALTKALNCQ